MLDHMLALIAFWAGFDLSLRCEGDLHVDAHHVTEDVGLCLGQALFQALGERRGITRAAWARVPMDEALAEVQQSRSDFRAASVAQMQKKREELAQSAEKQA